MKSCKIGGLTVDEKVVEVGATLHGGVEEASHVGAVFGEFVHLSLVVQTQLWVDHVPVLTMPHKQRNSPVMGNRQRGGKEMID